MSHPVVNAIAQGFLNALRVADCRRENTVRVGGGTDAAATAHYRRDARSGQRREREAAVEFRILGPIEVVGDDGEHAALGGSRPRALLASLLLQPGRAVNRDSLIRGLWDVPPATASHAVEVYVSRLRGVVGRDRIRCQGHAYCVEVEPDELDLARFRALVVAARCAIAEGDLERAADSLARAFAVWRGEAVACLNGEPLGADARGFLEEERLAAVELDVDVRLDLGHHDELVPELRMLVASQPTRERLWARLMLALYRCGRQIDALGVFGCVRTRLREELGIDPGLDLRMLQRRILEHDPALALPLTPAGSSSTRVR
jgi:DNA-binding SARP family transcriptional activator